MITTSFKKTKRLLNNVGNFYLSCFVEANATYNINQFVLQEVGILLGVVSDL